MHTDSSLEADQGASELAARMENMDDVMETILSETLNSAQAGRIKEAGRTVCPKGKGIKGPLRRYPRAIDLASCPVSKGGVFHTHVSPTEIRNPTNSLPDMANVIYGLTDVSIVAGTETADVVVAATDSEAMVEEFQHALGMSVSSPRELYSAIKNYRIMPTEARNRARELLSPLVYTAETGFADLDTAVDGIPAENWAPPAVSGEDETFSGQSEPVGFNADSVNDAAENMDGLVDGNELKGLVISTTVGTIIGGVVNKVVFGE